MELLLLSLVLWFCLIVLIGLAVVVLIAGISSIFRREQDELDDLIEKFDKANDAAIRDVVFRRMQSPSFQIDYPNGEGFDFEAEVRKLKKIVSA